jgi:hypothetical protein
MRIVAVEEHFTFPDLLSRIDLATLERNRWPAPGAATLISRECMATDLWIWPAEGPANLKRRSADLGKSRRDRFRQIRPILGDREILRVRA